jgi:hypothetical protein
VDEIVMACVERVTQEYTWQRRISRGECPTCGQRDCACPPIRSGKECAEEWTSKQGQSVIL